jgi:hypothetical protein
VFDLFETALDMEGERRREVLLATMRAARGDRSRRQVQGVARARTVWAAIATALA